MATTYEAIATVEVGAGGASSIEFTSIPTDGTYTDLLISVSARGTGGTTFDDLFITINNSTTGFSTRTLNGDGSSAASYTNSDNYAGWSPGNSATASTFGNHQFYFPNYAGSNAKSYSFDGVAENNATFAGTVLGASLWNNSAAITSIKFTVRSTANLAQYSSATLYGIKNS